MPCVRVHIDATAMLQLLQQAGVVSTDIAKFMAWFDGGVMTMTLDSALKLSGRIKPNRRDTPLAYTVPAAHVQIAGSPIAGSPEVAPQAHYETSGIPWKPAQLQALPKRERRKLY